MLRAKCFALLPQLGSAHTILMDWVRAGGLRAMGGIVGSEVKLGTRKILGRPVQVAPIKPTSTAPGIKCFKTEMC
jgi:hypothetical protein